MNIAIVGGGITGLCIALESAKRGANVTLFEKNKIMTATSNSSTKLLHGGLRYLENYEFKLVREALIERDWWIKNVPSLAKPIKIQLPIYKNSSRSKLKYKLGLWFYDKLAGNKNIKNHKWLNKFLFIKNNRILNSQNIEGGFVFYDGQMDDYKLGCWVANKAKQSGVKIKENHKITNISSTGRLIFLNKSLNIKKNESRVYDKIIIAAGSYTEDLLTANNISPKYKINHVRGSHIIIDKYIDTGYFLEYPKEKRIFFVLPYKNQTLIGTTEEEQKLNEPIKCSQKEIDYLIKGYNTYFKHKITNDDIVKVFSGLRPLIRSNKNYSKSSREYAIQHYDKLTAVYGGKWTTSRALARKICNQIKINI